MEILASSVTPLELMTGKIIGQSLVILTQLAVWAGLGVGARLYFGALSDEASTIFASLTGMNLVWLLAFYLLGYFFFAALWTGVGAICTTEQEAQQMQLPIVMVQVVPLIAAIGLVRQPGGAAAVALSLIPFFAPMVMMLRIVLETPPMWQILLSLGLLGLGIVVAFWAVSRIFRVGILMTGKRMTIPEVLRWLRA
jgi:ABC-2 type transport system permease protein